MKILISGAGVAGIALALQLDTTQHEVTLIERAPEFRNAGFSILLWETGRTILERLLGDKINDACWPMQSLDFYVGVPLKSAWSLKTGTIAGTARRQDIMELLSIELTQNRPAVNIRFNTEMISIEQDEDSATVTFKDATVEKYDVVVIAEGVNSFMRDKYFETKQITEPYYARYQWLKTVQALEKRAVFGVIPGICYFLQPVGEYSALGYYTDGRLDAEDRVLASLDEIDWVRNAGISIDKDSIRDFTIKTITPHSGVKGRLVLVGDAYHAHAPTIGYGTSLALEDGTSLAAALNSESIRERGVLAKHLHAYERQRRNRIARVYGLQDVIEKLAITENDTYLNAVRELLPLGGAQTLEMWLHKIVHYSVKPR
jgi:2-polyprenyl-6-methoxyphenol hydroxylase-like FAD-dependent oxidoreductase